MAAALAAGNSVIAKPAEQTPLVAAAMVRLLHAAGIPGDVLHFVPGRGSRIGPALTGDPRIAGVAFTGSTETARLINRSLAAHDGPLPALIAETGGQNAMLVDSSALPEQVVNDAVTSAFNAAGQRCSALRVLFVQEDIAPRVLELLAGVMDTLTIGNPALLSTDVGPVIDEEALTTLEAHARAIVAGSPWQHRAGAAERARARALLRAARGRDRRYRAARARSVRPDPARGPLSGDRAWRRSSRRSTRAATASRSACTRASTAWRAWSRRARASATST